MSQEYEILWLITARSGSQGIKDKNIRVLKELPLLAYRVLSARSVSLSSRIWCSTDSESYADIAAGYGADIPYIRPAALAASNSSSIDVVLHAMDFATSQGYRFKYIGLLEPTSPFIFHQDLENAVQQLAASDDDAIVAVREVHPNKVFVQDEDVHLQEVSENIRRLSVVGRQAFKTQITPSGGFYIARWDRFLKEKTFYAPLTRAYKVPDECGLEIDEPMDWMWAEFLLEKQIVDINKIYKK